MKEPIFGYISIIYLKGSIKQMNVLKHRSVKCIQIIVPLIFLAVRYKSSSTDAKLNVSKKLAVWEQTKEFIDSAIFKGNLNNFAY